MGSLSQNRWLAVMLGAMADETRSFQLPGAKPHYRPDRPGIVEHLALDLRLNLADRSCQGTCRIRLRPIRDGIDQLELDAVQLRVDAVQLGKRSLKFDQDDHKLFIHLHQPTARGKTIELAIDYQIHQPQRGIYFIQPDQDYPNKPVQVWTQGEDEDSRFWFPCFDVPGQLASSDLRVQVPKPYKAISNGELIATIEAGDDLIYHWQQKEPHPNYLMTLAVGDFAEIRDQWRDKDVTYYVEKSRADDARRSMGKTPAMIEFLSDRYGVAYPYAKYAQVCVEDFIFGGMENTSTTLLTDRCLLDERAAIDNRNTEALVVHELAHQWFGDLLAIKHWSHAWIKEGMATYSETLWTDHEYGADEAAYYRLQDLRSYLSEDRDRYRRPMVTHIYREPIELYDCHIYEKGGCVYHAIHAELGDDLFWRSIQTFTQTHAFQPVETIDLLRAIETATGRNLQSLFDQFVFRGGHPDYKVSYAWDAESHLAKLTISQTQAKEDDLETLFDLKIPIAFGYLTTDSVDAGAETTGTTGELKTTQKSGTKTKTTKASKTKTSSAAIAQPTLVKAIQMTAEGDDRAGSPAKSKTGEKTKAKPKDKTKKTKAPESDQTTTEPVSVSLTTFKIAIRDREQTFYFPLPKKPDFVSFDAGNHTIKTVELEYPLAELKAQLQHDPDPLSRIVAAEAIARKGGLEALQSLALALTSDRFWGVRVEVAAALATIPLDGVLAALEPGLRDPDPRVRRSVVSALATLKTPAAYEAIEPLARQGDPSYLTEAAALAALGQIAASQAGSQANSQDTGEPDLTDRTIALLQTVLAERAGWNEVVRAGAISGLSQLKTSIAALDLVLAYTEPGTPQPLRLAAIRALGPLATRQEPVQVDRILDRLRDLSRDSFFLTQMAVVSALGASETAKAIGLLQPLADQAADGRICRQAAEAIKRVQRSLRSNAALDRLRDELDQIKKDNQTLRSRLEAIEAKAQS